MPFAVLLLLSAVSSVSVDWPQWLGPRRDGTSREEIRPWGEPPVVVWRRAVGEGHSAPVVYRGRVFLHTKVKDRDEEEVTALDAVSGELRWSERYARGPFGNIFGNGPRATPAVADGRVITHGVTGILSCFDADGGKLLWRHDTLKEFHAPPLFFGSSCSPLVFGDLVLLNVGASGASVVAFDVSSGDVRWKALDDRASYSSPAVVSAGETRQAVFLTQQGVVSLSPGTGDLLWRYPLADQLNENSITPLSVEGTVLAGSITTGLTGLRASANETKPEARERWKNPDLTCYFSTPLGVGGGRAFVVTGTKPFSGTPQAALRCIDVNTGKEIWQRDKVGRYHASLTQTGDGKVLMLEDSGDLVLLDPAAGAYRELARAKVCGETWSYPALADSRLYVRDRNELICLRLAR